MLFGKTYSVLTDMIQTLKAHKEGTIEGRSNKRSSSFFPGSSTTDI